MHYDAPLLTESIMLYKGDPTVQMAAVHCKKKILKNTKKNTGGSKTINECMLTIKTAKLVKWVHPQTTLSFVALLDTYNCSALTVSFPRTMEMRSHPS